MSDKKIIAIVGATGAQGGGLLSAILADPDGPFTARALTRNAGSDPARELASQGAEVIEADLDDETSLRKAFDGAYGAYVVTNFWVQRTPEQEQARTRAQMELDQAAAAARAAKDTELRHVVWFTLEDTRPHFARLGSNVPECGSHTHRHSRPPTPAVVALPCHGRAQTTVVGDSRSMISTAKSWRHNKCISAGSAVRFGYEVAQAISPIVDPGPLSAARRTSSTTLSWNNHGRRYPARNRILRYSVLGGSCASSYFQPLDSTTRRVSSKRRAYFGLSIRAFRVTSITRGSSSLRTR
jgi:hypothetical protein